MKNVPNIRSQTGNAAEWVWDRYGVQRSGRHKDPTGPDQGEQRVVVGGAYDDLDVPALGMSRSGLDVTAAAQNIGFRIARR